VIIPPFTRQLNNRNQGLYIDLGAGGAGHGTDLHEPDVVPKNLFRRPPVTQPTAEFFWGSPGHLAAPGGPGPAPSPFPRNFPPLDPHTKGSSTPEG